MDIGSNDATTLKAYPKKFKLIGYDPTAKKFAKYYPKYIDYVSNFFSYKSFKRRFSNIKADIITSFSMFYDLEEPLKFMNEINQSLSDDGIWVFEQSYLPFMIKTVSFDTICHEHLEYYSLTDIVLFLLISGLVVSASIKLFNFESKNYNYSLTR